ncbi:MAG: hypothetical protein ABSF28_00060 [Terracidiphilus sp.]
MTIQRFQRSITNGSASLILAGLLGVSWLASGAADAKKPAAPAPKAAPKPAAAPKASAPAGGAHTAPAGGTHAGATTTGAHTTTTTTHTTTTTSHTTTTTGTHTTVGGAHPGGPGGAGAHGGAAGGTRNTAFKSPAPRGSNERVTRSGSAVRTRPGGRVADVHDARRGMDVHHGLAGGHRVSMERHDGSRVYAERGRRGYVERGYHYHGHDFARRSYFYHGRSYDRFYRGYGYRGLMLNVYAPGFYFRPAFYGWAYNPWAAPIAFGWGWGVATPWYGFYGGYFHPYAVYPSAAFWLTDYIISQDLAAAYAAHQEAAEQAAAPPADGPPVLTPEVKQMIADEVRNQLALENAEAGQNAQQQDVDPGSSGIARLLSDGRPHVFVAGGNLDVTDASGQECAVSDGDTLQLREPPPSDATAANLVVLSSKGNPECSISLTVQVQLTDLQEMQNHMRETIDQGLQDLQAKQGTGGLPAAPASAEGPTAPAAYAAVAPPPEPDPGADIQAADQQSVQAEKDVTAEAAADAGGQASAAPAPASPDAPAAPAAQPASIELGQTTDQVTAALGAPTRIANLGPKVIYYYSGMKVTFKEGKVSDVQ